MRRPEKQCRIQAVIVITDHGPYPVKTLDELITKNRAN